VSPTQVFEAYAELEQPGRYGLGKARLHELHGWVQPDAPAVHPCPDTDDARRAKRVRYEIEADESTRWYELWNEGKELLTRIRGFCTLTSTSGFF